VFKFDMNSGKKQHITDEKQIIEEFHVNKSGSGFTHIVEAIFVIEGTCRLKSP